MSTVFYEGGGFRVDEALLRTPRKTYALAQIEYVSVARPLLIFAGLPAVGTIAFAIAFRRYLLAGEIATLVVLAAAALAVAITFGTLRVHSLAMRGDDVGVTFGLISRLRRVRAAVEQAMLRRREGPR